MDKSIGFWMIWLLLLESAAARPPFPPRSAVPAARSESVKYEYHQRNELTTLAREAGPPLRPTFAEQLSWAWHRGRAWAVGLAKAPGSSASGQGHTHPQGAPDLLSHTAPLHRRLMAAAKSAVSEVYEAALQALWAKMEAKERQVS